VTLSRAMAAGLLAAGLLAAACSVDPDSGLPPDASSPPSVEAAVEAAADSTVGVEGTACRVAVRGSGFVVEPGLVATAAHVVAGVERPSVRVGDGTAVPAVLVAFDPARDLALLEVDLPSSAGPPSPRRDPVPVEDAVVLARHDDAELRPFAVRIVDTVLARGPDIRGEGSFTRQVAVLEGEVGEGDSGAPVVGEDGAVLGVVVAVSTERPGTAYAVRPAELDAVLGAVSGAPVPPGPCP
jgi:S1-C subfamily serine protease